MNENVLLEHLQNYINKMQAEPDTTLAHIEERAKRRQYYQGFKADDIMHFNHEQFYDYITKLWAMKIWGNKQYIVNKIIEDNGFEKLKSNICDLLYGQDNIENRWDSFKSRVKGFGPAMMSEMLCNVYPEKYMVWNGIAKTTYRVLGIQVPKYNYLVNGEKYVELSKFAIQIKNLLLEKYGKNEDLLFIDYFFYSEFKDAELPPTTAEEAQTTSNNKSYHNEIIEYIKEIGNLLGYNGNASCKINNSGKVADAAWEFNVGNIGKIRYVFEVQESGSIDSLLISLQNASQDISTQAVVAVSDEKQIEKIRQHSNNIKGNFNGKMRFWDSAEVEKVHSQLLDSMGRINSILEKDGFQS